MDVAVIISLLLSLNSDVPSDFSFHLFLSKLISLYFMSFPPLILLVIQNLFPSKMLAFLRDFYATLRLYSGTDLFCEEPHLHAKFPLSVKLIFVHGRK